MDNHSPLLDPSSADRDQYLWMRALASRSAASGERPRSTEIASVVAGLHDWSAAWVAEYERAHPAPDDAAA